MPFETKEYLTAGATVITAIKPLCARGFSRGFAARAVPAAFGLLVPRVSAELQTAKQTRTTSKILTEFTYVHFGLPLPSKDEKK